MSDLCKFQKTFEVEKYTICKNSHWTWSLRPAQPTLGSGILSLNTYCESFSKAPEGAGESLQEIVRIIEGTLRNCFEYEKINYLMLMMVDAHVHYHVIPRYSEDRTFNDLEWVDSGWPKFPALSDAQHSSYESLNTILDTLITSSQSFS